VVPDNGTGTADLPPATPSPNCTTGYLSPDDVHMIIDGLPPGQTIEIGVEHDGFICPPAPTVCSFTPGPGPGGDLSCAKGGGGLGGEQECAGSNLELTMQGAGGLTYTRTVDLPTEFETHTAPRTPGQPVQSFDTDMFRLLGQLPPGDPDFDLLRIRAGSGFGLPSPGHTTLIQTTGGGWAVDSFFDITYEIDFIGAPGGPFAGMSGTTTGTIRMGLGGPFDHLECFKVKDSIKVEAVVDLPTLAGTPYDAAGCKLGKAKKWCTPAQKIVVSSTPPAVPLPGPNLTSDYICYGIKCPKVDLSTTATDQFGTHSLGKMKQGELCVPAP
jgi:hypothetical protein